METICGDEGIKDKVEIKTDKKRRISTTMFKWIGLFILFCVAIPYSLMVVFVIFLFRMLVKELRKVKDLWEGKEYK